MPRRANPVRTAEMRQRLLASTLTCLAERGFAGATTAMIARHAGVSRGAQTHHFPSRTALMVAAVEHVFEGRRAALGQALAELPRGPDRLSEALRQLWLAVQGGPTLAWLELVVAARHDPALQAQVVDMTEGLRHAAATVLADLFDADDLPPEGLLLATAVMDGLVVQQLAGLDDDRRDRVLALLDSLAHSITSRS